MDLNVAISMVTDFCNSGWWAGLHFVPPRDALAVVDVKSPLICNILRNHPIVRGKPLSPQPASQCRSSMVLGGVRGDHLQGCARLYCLSESLAG